MNPDSSQNPPMNWHDFLIHFSLWIDAISTLFLAIATMTGAQYSNFDTIYAQFPALKVSNVIFGIQLLGLAFFEIYVRHQLAGLREEAPTKFLLSQACALFLSIEQVLATILVLEGNLLSLLSIDLISSIVGTGIWMAINNAYYKKRQHLFVNRPAPNPHLLWHHFLTHVALWIIGAFLLTADFVILPSASAIFDKTSDPGIVVRLLLSILMFFLPLLGIFMLVTCSHLAAFRCFDRRTVDVCIIRSLGPDAVIVDLHILIE